MEKWSDIKKWAKSLSYEDLVYLCGISDIEWFPHHCTKKDLLDKLTELDYQCLNSGYSIINNMYKIGRHYV